MSLYGALFGGVSGLRAQSSRIGMVSDNIANVNTIGYKSARAAFQTLVVNSSSAGAYSTGGVRSSTQLNVSKQGLLQSTESATDIAISGGGFFVVKATPEFSSLSTPYYSRAGSFTQDSLGNFINSQGYYLQGWPLDREGRLPGETGNLNTTSFTDLTSLRTVNVESASGSAQATSSLSLGANLKAGETVFPGQDGIFTMDINNSGNLNMSSTSIIVGAEYGGFGNTAGADGVRRGDVFTISAGTQNYSLEYGGFTVGRDVTTAVSNFGDNNINNRDLIDSGTVTTDIVYRGVSTLELNVPNHNLIDGDRVQLNGLSAVGTITALELNTTHTITYVDKDTIQITVTGGNVHSQVAGTSPAVADSFSANTHASVATGNILDATTSGGNFLGITGTTGYTAEALTFTITSTDSGTVTFRYTGATPNASNGEFRDLTSLASAINAVTGLTARVASGRLVVGAEDANQPITFENGDAVGTDTKRGIDWVSELGVQNYILGDNRFSTIGNLATAADALEGVSAAVDNPLSNPTLRIRVDDPRSTIAFSDLTPATVITSGNDVTTTATAYDVGDPVTITIEGSLPSGANNGDLVYLSNLAFASSPFPGLLPNGGPFVLSNIVAGTSFDITFDAPVAFTTAAATITTTQAATVSLSGTTNHGALLAHLGLSNGLASAATPIASLAGVAYSGNPQSSGALGPKYSALGGTTGENMASGDITAQFSRNIRVYDSLGSGHDLRASFIKISTNSWAVEVHSIPAADITEGTGLVNGQIATGTITFNGDGTLQSISSELISDNLADTDGHNIIWRNGATSSRIALDFGTAGSIFGTPNATIIGLANGLSQFDSGYNVNFATQNGAPVGQLVSVSIDTDGFVIASYSNGETASLYKLPLADFANPDGLQAVSGNVFSQTRGSGEQNLREAGTNGTGTVVGAALEQSNVDLAEQLTDMIVAQRSYQANTKVIKTADELLESLNNI